MKKYLLLSIFVFVSINLLSQNQDSTRLQSNTNNKTVKSKNHTIIGFQIGGFGLIGIDYELRVHDYFGIHAGIGLSGYTLGANIHIRPDKNSSFVNISYKDAGFGLVNTFGLEFGGKLRFNKQKDFGLFAQLGFAKIMKIDPVYAKKLFKNGEIPDLILSFGIGFGF